MIINVLKFKRIIMLCTVVFMNVLFVGTANANFFSDIMPKFTISGKITNQNQEPLEGVTVTFSSNGLGGESRTVTDVMGNYVINPPAKTTGVLTISKENYRIIRQNWGYYAKAGETCVSNFKLNSDWIGGKITNLDGEPIEGVKITFELDGGLTGIQTVFTDENGNYRCTIPADYRNYWVTIQKEGYQTFRDHPCLVGGNVRNFKLQ